MRSYIEICIIMWKLQIKCMFNYQIKMQMKYASRMYRESARLSIYYIEKATGTFIRFYGCP